MTKEQEKWLNYALNLLSVKMRTEREMREKLEKKQVEETMIQLVLSYLKEKRFIDDSHYAKVYIESHQNRYGPYRLKQSLRQKGVTDEKIQWAFEELEASLNPEVEAERILKKKLDTLSIDFDQVKSDYVYRRKMQNKLSQFLAYRGFSIDVIRHVVSRLLTEEFFDE